MRSAVLGILALALAGCVAPAQEVVTASDPAAAAPVEGPALPQTEEYEIGFLYSVATPARSTGGAVPDENLALEDGLTGYVVEAEWTPATPAASKLSMWVRVAGAGAVPPHEPGSLVTPPEPVAKVSGGSPLRVVVPADLLEDGTEYEVIVRAAAEPVGAGAQQPVTLYVTRFVGLALDEGFTAIGNDEAK